MKNNFHVIAKATALLLSVFLMINILHCSPMEKRLSENQIVLFASVYAKYLHTITADTAKADRYQVYLEQILRSHGLTQETFVLYKDMLENDPQAFKKMLELVNQTLQPHATNLPEAQLANYRPPLSARPDSLKAHRTVPVMTKDKLIRPRH